MGKQAKLKQARREFKAPSSTIRSVKAIERLQRQFQKEDNRNKQLERAAELRNPNLPKLQPSQSETSDAEYWRWDYESNPLPWREMQQNLNALVTSSSPLTPKNSGKVKLFQSLIVCVTEGDCNQTLLKEAGQQFWNCGGILSMQSAAELTPKSCHSLIDYAWDGIGTWRC